MKKTAKLIEKFQTLADGGSVPSSSLRGDWINEMLADNILQRISHGRKTSYVAANCQSFLQYIASKFEIRNLTETYRLLHDEELSRSSMVEVTGDSKFVHQRTMKGFLVNSYEDIPASLNDSPFTVHPVDGSFCFIYDYESFTIPDDVTVVGIENSENFRMIARQKHLFDDYFGADHRLLFVSRYPQSKDLIRWLEGIPNRYVHFGDLDLAGIHIFLSEFNKRLGDRSSFLIPRDYKERIAKGSTDRYTVQYPKYGNMHIADDSLRRLFDFINKEHKGYDQEGYIDSTI